MKKLLFIISFVFAAFYIQAENNYRLRLHYDKIDDAKLVSTYQYSINTINLIDPKKNDHVLLLLNIQDKETLWWHNACFLYFQTLSKMPIPLNYEKPVHTLEYYESLEFPYAPDNGK